MRACVRCPAPPPPSAALVCDGGLATAPSLHAAVVFAGKSEPSQAKKMLLQRDLGRAGCDEKRARQRNPRRCIATANQSRIQRIGQSRFGTSAEFRPLFSDPAQVDPVLAPWTAGIVVMTTKEFVYAAVPALLRSICERHQASGLFLPPCWPCRKCRKCRGHVHRQDPTDKSGVCPARRCALPS